MPKKLLAEYRTPPNSYDELLDAGNQPREHWRAMLASLAKESPADSLVTVCPPLNSHGGGSCTSETVRFISTLPQEGTTYQAPLS